MKTIQQGILFNMAGHKRYKGPASTENVIRYVTRTNKDSKNDLIAWGGIGITEFMGMEHIIRQFSLTQKMHTRRGNFGRYIDHEFYSLSDEEEACIHENKLDADKIARKMAYDFYETDQCQVIYGVHAPEGKHMHIHFAINTVNYKTGNKRRENMQQTREREKRFQKIVAD